MRYGIVGACMFLAAIKSLAALIITVIGSGVVAGAVIISQSNIVAQAEKLPENHPLCWMEWLAPDACKTDVIDPNSPAKIAAEASSFDWSNQLTELKVTIASLSDTVTNLLVTTPPTTLINSGTQTIISDRAYSAGTGISIENGVIKNTDLGSVQSIIKKLEVSGSETITINDNDDVLKFIAGTNINLVSDTDANAIYISGTGSGSYSQIYEVGSSIGIGTATPAYTLDVNGTLAVATNSGIRLSANNPNSGSITRSISLIARTQYDRPWISSIDYTGRHAASFGVHHTNYADGDLHKRWELKTSADPNGSNPSVMLTRFAIDYDTDIANVIFGDVGTIGTHNDYGQRAIFVHNMTTADGNQSINVGQWTSELGAGDSTVMTFDAKTLDNTKNATIRFFRETNTSGQRKLVVLKGDGTATESVTIDASTGLVTTFANGEGLRMGDGTNTSAYANMQSNRTMVGYDGSNAVLQGGTNKGIKFNVNSSSFGAGTAMMLTSAGRLGINTTDPAALLSVGSSSEFQVDTTGNIVAPSASLSAGLTLSTAAGIQSTANQLLTIGGTTTGNIALLPANGTGRVGIGTTSPSAALHIARNSETLRLGDDTNVTSYINVQSNRTLFGYDGSNAVFQGGTNKGIKFNVNSSSFGTGTAVTIDTSGNVGFGVTPTLGPIHAANGAYLTSGGSWQNASDRNVKEGFEQVDAQAVLSKINLLPVSEWSYIKEGLSVRHIGPTAQDFWAAFGLGNTDTSISTIDPAGVALVGIQGLSLNYAQLADRVEVTELDAKKIQSMPGLSVSEVESLIDDKMAKTGWLAQSQTWLFAVAATFQQKVAFLSQVIFEGPVEFLSSPMFGKDTGGSAIINAGADRVTVAFARAYDIPPQVTLTLNTSLTSDVDPQAIFNQNLQYSVSDVTKTGFTILIQRPATTQIGFTWTALMVKDAASAVGEPTTKPSSTPIPTATQPPSDSTQEQLKEVNSEHTLKNDSSDIHPSNLKTPESAFETINPELIATISASLSEPAALVSETP